MKLNFFNFLFCLPLRARREELTNGAAIVTTQREASPAGELVQGGIAQHPGSQI